MATRAGGNKKPTKPRGVSATVRNLAKKKGGKLGGSNSGEKVQSLVVGKAAEESFVIWEGKIKTQFKQVEAAKKLVQKEAGDLNNLVGQAKEAGIPADRLSALKKRLKLEARPIEDVVAEHREMAWQVSVSKGSPLKQLGLFEIAEPTLDGYEELGYIAGKNGRNMDEAPGKPGEEKHARWVTGWRRGQAELAKSTFNPAADDKAD